MALVIYNSLSRTKEVFAPLIPGQVKMYCCGPTVYDFLHVGNFRGAVFFNFMRNWLEHQGYRVKYVYNFTDIDDKILNRADKENLSPRLVAETYIKEFKQDFGALRLTAHDVNPRVTDHVEDIIAFTQKLIESGHAYAVDGNVYYSVKSFAGYGKLSGRTVEDQMSGVRIDVEADKHDPQDFALWKKAKPGEESWPSPWGNGRPGWHIECSAMAHRHLGEQIDIHGGGSDLRFPHHENEIAQSEGHSGRQFARYWVHNNMFTFGGSKMSKSLGNILTMRSFLGEYHPEIYKFLVLSAHYRSTQEFSDRTIHEAIAGLAKVYSAVSCARAFHAGDAPDAPPDFAEKAREFRQTADAAINDDFNMPVFFAALHELMHEFNRRVHRGLAVQPKTQAVASAFLRALEPYSCMMSLFQEDPDGFLKAMDDLLLAQMQLSRSEVQELVDARAAARANKDFAASDRLRQELTDKGILLQDSPTGTFWEVKK